MFPEGFLSAHVLQSRFQSLCLLSVFASLLTGSVFIFRQQHPWAQAQSPGLPWSRSREVVPAPWRRQMGRIGKPPPGLDWALRRCWQGLEEANIKVKVGSFQHKGLGGPSLSWAVPRMTASLKIPVSVHLSIYPFSFRPFLLLFLPPSLPLSFHRSIHRSMHRSIHPLPSAFAAPSGSFFFTFSPTLSGSCWGMCGVTVGASLGSRTG